jgi:hypothetical protein
MRLKTRHLREGTKHSKNGMKINQFFGFTRGFKAFLSVFVASCVTDLSSYE